jgi:hypothetical protein
MDDEIRTHRMQAARDRSSDTACATGNQNRFVFQCSAHRLKIRRAAVNGAIRRMLFILTY